MGTRKITKVKKKWNDNNIESNEIMQYIHRDLRTLGNINAQLEAQRGPPYQMGWKQFTGVANGLCEMGWHTSTGVANGLRKQGWHTSIAGVNGHQGAVVNWPAACSVFTDRRDDYHSMMAPTASTVPLSMMYRPAHGLENHTALSRMKLLMCIGITITMKLHQMHCTTRVFFSLHTARP